VHAGEEALDDVAGADVEPGDPGDGLRVQKAAGIVFFYWHGDGPFTARINRPLAVPRSPCLVRDF
jgi:hypothetical protein